MARLSFFGPPGDAAQQGGAHVAVYLVPVFHGQLATFDVDIPGVRGRFLPWTILEYGGNPYADASLLVDDWCEGAVSDLRLVDVIGGHRVEGSQELAIVFRAELTAPPAGDPNRVTALVPGDAVEQVGPFPASELQRWVAFEDVEHTPTPGPRAAAARPGDHEAPRLLF